MQTKGQYRSVVARLLLLVQLFMLSNTVVFRHAHRLPDGTIVVHAHPFLPKANGPVQPNDHTRQELVWLDALTQATYLEPDCPTFAWPNVPALAFDDPIDRAVVARVQSVRLFCSLRGPPVGV